MTLTVQNLPKTVQSAARFEAQIDGLRADCTVCALICALHTDGDPIKDLFRSCFC
jgi:hypothetical protein